jgi:hypothetical protein
VDFITGTNGASPERCGRLGAFPAPDQSHSDPLIPEKAALPLAGVSMQIAGGG